MVFLSIGANHKTRLQCTMAFCGLLCVDHYSVDKVVEHFFIFMEEIGLDVKFMLHLGMDGPNVKNCFYSHIY